MFTCYKWRQKRKLFGVTFKFHDDIYEGRSSKQRYKLKRCCVGFKFFRARKYLITE